MRTQTSCRAVRGSGLARSATMLVLLCLVLTCVGSTLMAGDQAADQPQWLIDKRVTVTITDMPLAEAIDTIFKNAEVAYRVIPRLPAEQKVSLSYTNTPLTAGLRVLLSTHGLIYTVDGDTLVIDADPAKAPANASASMTSTKSSSSTDSITGSETQVSTMTSVGTSTSTSCGGGGSASAGGSITYGPGGTEAGGTLSTGTVTSISTSGGSMSGSGTFPPGDFGAVGGAIGFSARSDDPAWLAAKRVSVQINNMSLADAVDKLLRDAGIRYRVLTKLPGNLMVSVGYGNVPLAGALRSLLEPHGFTYSVVGNEVVINAIKQRGDKPTSLLAGKYVTTSIQNLSVGEAIAKLLQDAGVNYRIAAALPGNMVVSLSYSNVSLADALNSLLTQHGLTSYADGDTLVIDWASPR